MVGAATRFGSGCKYVRGTARLPPCGSDEPGDPGPEGVQEASGWREWWREQPDPGDPGTGPGQPELEFWRVEAAPGQGMTPEVYELRQDVATGAWTICLS